MTKRRSARVNDVYPWREDADGNRLCAVCGKAVASKRAKYCGAECRDHAYITTSPGWARGSVYKRDKGVCSQCGFDSAKFKRILLRARRWWYKLTGQTWAMYLYCAGWNPREQLGLPRTHLWEMDHIQPVCEGGGLCGLDNLRTLCVPCHKKETAAMRKKQAAKK